MNMKLLAAVAALGVAPATITAAQAQQRVPAATIVIVDTDRIYRECTACVAAQAQLTAQATALQQRAQQLRQPIQTEAQSLEQAAAAARNQTGAARTAAEQALQTRLTALRQQETTANQELQQREQTIRSTQAHVLQQINARLNPIVNQVMTQRGANIAMDTGATLSSSPALNVTDQVLAALNQQLPAVSVTPLPQPAQPTVPVQPQTPRPTGR